MSHAADVGTPGKGPAVVVQAARLALWPATIAVVLAVPFLVSSVYSQGIVNQVLIFIVLATGYNIVLGYTGLVSLGHVALFAIGAYTSAILTTRWDVPFLVAFVCAALLAAIVGAVIGFSALRIKGHYLTLLTLAFSEAAILMLRNLTGLTGGSEGIVGIARPALFGYQLTDPTALYFFLARVRSARDPRRAAP